MIDPNEFYEYVERQIGYTQEHLDKPVDSPHFPGPQYWAGYRRAMADIRGAVQVWETKPA